MQFTILSIFAVFALANASVVVDKVLEGPFQRSVIAGPDGSVITSEAQAGAISENLGPIPPVFKTVRTVPLSSEVVYKTVPAPVLTRYAAPYTRAVVAPLATRTVVAPFAARAVVAPYPARAVVAPYPARAYAPEYLLPSHERTVISGPSGRIVTDDALHAKYVVPSSYGYGRSYIL